MDSELALKNIDSGSSPASLDLDTEGCPLRLANRAARSMTREDRGRMLQVRPTLHLSTSSPSSAHQLGTRDRPAVTRVRRPAPTRNEPIGTVRSPLRAGASNCPTAGGSMDTPPPR